MNTSIDSLIASYDLVRLEQGMTDEVCDAYIKAIQYLIFTEKDVESGLALADKVKGYINDTCLKSTGADFWGLERYMMGHSESYNIVNSMYEVFKIESFWNFESFMFYLERDREQLARFYFPRRMTLEVVAHDLEDLANRVIKFLGVSLPSRTGKSTIGIMFMSWLAMKRPNSHSAMGGHAGTLVKGFYKELINIMTSAEYRYEELYSYWHPNCEMIRDKSAEDYTITMDKADRFATIVCRGIDATWTGAVDVSWDGILYVDDLVRDREHSLSPSRMENTWQEYLNKMVDRKSGFDPKDSSFAGACELMIGTLWNVYDPLYRMEQKYKNNPLYRFRKIPALDPITDESNFNYEINGFTTEYFKEIRERLAEPEWQAKYQQAPFVREGLLYKREELNYFDGFLEDVESKTIAVLDPAVGGGDNCSMPIICDSNRKYIIDWVYNKGSQKITIPLICNKIIFHNVTELHIEKNGVGRLFEDAIKQELASRNYNRCRILTHSAPTKMSKEEKILCYSDWIKANLWFLDENRVAVEGKYTRSTEYDKAMADLHMYTAIGKNEHDDAPDVLSQVARVYEQQGNGTVDIIKNPFGY